LKSLNNQNNIKQVKLDCNTLLQNTDNSNNIDRNLNTNLNTDVKKIDIILENTNKKQTEKDLDLDLNELLNGNSNSNSNSGDNIKPNENSDSDIKKIDIESESKLNINNMSIKQLKDLAKTYKLKTTGTKSELIATLSKVL